MRNKNDSAPDPLDRVLNSEDYNPEQKRREREELDRMMKAYLKKGGSIEMCPTRRAADWDDNSIFSINPEKQSKIPRKKRSKK